MDVVPFLAAWGAGGGGGGPLTGTLTPPQNFVIVGEHFASLS